MAEAAPLPRNLKVDQIKQQLSAAGLPTKGTKPELLQRLVDHQVDPLTVPQLKDQLKTHGQPITGKKEDLVTRLKAFLSGQAPSLVPPPAEKEPKIANLPETFEPAALSLADLKAVAKGLGISASGRQADVLLGVVTTTLDNLTAQGLKDAAKARGLPATGNKTELKAALTTYLTTKGATPPAPPAEAEININEASDKELNNLPGIGPKLSERIIANRPYTSLVDLKKKVAMLGPETLKAIAHRLVGWTEPPPNNVTPLILNDDNAAAAAERRANHEFMLASWNIRNISNKKTDANLQKIANLIQKFDFLSVQEVRDVEVMQRLKAMLGAEWDMAVSDFIGTEHHKERYAFLWRNTIVTVLTPPELLHDHQDVFVREPFIGYFRAGKFDFILSTIHIVWGASIVGRRSEIEKLDHLLKSLQVRAGNEKDLIICGDFNMPPVDVCWGCDGWEALILPPQKTVVGDSSLYDNIWINTEHTAKSEYKGRAGCIEFDKLLYEDSKSGRHAAMGEVSDHRPVWAVFASNVDDDAEAKVNLQNVTL